MSMAQKVLIVVGKQWNPEVGFLDTTIPFKDASDHLLKTGERLILNRKGEVIERLTPTQIAERTVLLGQQFNAIRRARKEKPRLVPEPTPKTQPTEKTDNFCLCVDTEPVYLFKTVYPFGKKSGGQMQVGRQVGYKCNDCGMFHAQQDAPRKLQQECPKPIKLVGKRLLYCEGKLINPKN